jgi:hypothetical protein
MSPVVNCAAHHPPASIPSTIPTFPPVNMARAWQARSAGPRPNQRIATFARTSIPTHIHGCIAPPRMASTH